MIVQALLSVEADKEDCWPAELLELRDKFTCNAKQEIQELKKAHNAELIRLRNDHDSILTKMLEQHEKETDILKTKTKNGDEKEEVIYDKSLESSLIEER